MVFKVPSALKDYVCPKPLPAWQNNHHCIIIVIIIWFPSIIPKISLARKIFFYFFFFKYFYLPNLYEGYLTALSPDYRISCEGSASVSFSNELSNFPHSHARLLKSGL